MDFLDRPIVMWVCAIVLFASGVVFALIFASGVTAEAIEHAISYLGSMATLIAALVAVLALNDWRSQFRHERLFDSLANMREAVADLSSYKDWNRSYRLIVMQEMLGNEPDRELRSNDMANHEQWLSSLQKFKSAYSDVSIYLGSPVAGLSSKHEDIHKRYLGFYLKVQELRHEKKRTELLQHFRLYDKETSELISKLQFDVNQLMSDAVK